MKYILGFLLPLVLFLYLWNAFVDAFSYYEQGDILRAIYNLLLANVLINIIRGSFNITRSK